MTEQDTSGQPTKGKFAKSLEDLPEALKDLALPAGIVLVITILSAIGITNDLLGRLLRNQPGWLTLALIVALVGVALPFFGRLITAMVEEGTAAPGGTGTKVASPTPGEGGTVALEISATRGGSGTPQATAVPGHQSPGSTPDLPPSPATVSRPRRGWRRRGKR